MRVSDPPLLDPAHGQTLQSLQPGLLEEAFKQSGPLAIAEALRNEAEAYISLGLSAPARRAIGQSLKAYERALGPRHPELGQIIADHALMLERIGDAENAQALRQRSWELSTGEAD
jgi:tetratricopeptide (TPR) repeat protein